MNLEKALHLIGARFNLDPQELIEYAHSNSIGGYHSDPAQSVWPAGSIWGVEGQIIHALVRATKPALCVQLGGWRGCSAAHIVRALEANGSGKLVSVDLYPEPQLRSQQVEYITGDGIAYVQDTMPAGEVGFLFEDMLHGEDEVETIWTAAVEKCSPGAFVVSHDSEHNVNGQDDGANVRNGIARAVGRNFLSVLVEPSDCGLALWRQP